MKADCPLCEESYRARAFARTRRCFAVPTDERPGGAMILPFAHRETPFDLDTEEWWDTRELLAVAREHIDRALAPHGYNVGWNVGMPGGQSIPHAHLHLVPRWADEPHAGKGMRWWIKQPDNIRPGSQ